MILHVSLKCTYPSVKKYLYKCTVKLCSMQGHFENLKPVEKQSYIYQVLQTIQMKLILLCVWAEMAVLGSAKTALKFIYKI